MLVAPPNAVTSPTLTTPQAASALVAVTTPLAGFSVQGSNDLDVTVIITAATGKLFAPIASGTTLSGSGTGSVWIAGPTAQVSAQLATLVYAASTTGTDAITVTLLDSLGQVSAPIIVPLQVLPLITAADALPPRMTIAGGTLALDERVLDGINLDLYDAQNGAGAATIILVDSTLGANTLLDVAASTSTEAPRLAVAGTVDVAGTIIFETGPALVTIARNGSLTNTGLIECLGAAASVSGGGTLVNNGNITIAAAALVTGPVIDAAISGTGTTSIGAGSQLELGAAVASSQTICFQSDTGTLVLDDPASMLGMIAGLRVGDQIELPGVQISSAAYTQIGADGVLTLFRGANVSARLTFAGVHQLSDFLVSVATDLPISGGASSTLSLAPAPGRAEAATVEHLDVWRFFDRTNGAQLLTQDPGERDAILGSRPDLILEGVAMQALANPAADPAATAVYRFFDTASGTYFFTANTAEKNALIATRPDLDFEPNSTIWEHATQQTGDVPVYRFFDAAAGTHFYTADPGERASVLATRADFTYEGVAFYAPTA